MTRRIALGALQDCCVEETGKTAYLASQTGTIDLIKGITTDASTVTDIFHPISYRIASDTS
jgi:hypothetical protein